MGWMLMPLKRYADFSGRSRRMEYWMWQVFKFIVAILFMTVFLVMFGAAFASLGATKDPSQLIAVAGGALLLWMIYMLFGLAIFIPDIAVAVRRLHDTNRTGWWIVAPLATYLIGVVATVATAGVGAGMGESDQVGTGMLAAGGIIGLVTGLATLALIITLLVFMFLDGTSGMNKYGPDPKGRDASQVFS